MFPFFVLLACGSSEQSQQMTSVPPPIEQPSVAVGSSSFDEENTKDLIRILSAYDGKSNCTGLPEQGLQEKLTHIVEHVSLPPWAPMRAASCLSQLYPEQAEKDLIRWVENPKTKGLAFLLAGQLTKLPDDVARNIAKAGLQGPHKHEFRVRLVRLQDPRISPILESIKE